MAFNIRIVIRSDFNNCYLNVISMQLIQSTDPIYLYANSGFKFDTTFTAYYYDSDYDKIIVTSKKVTDTQQQFIIEENLKDTTSLFFENDSNLYYAVADEPVSSLTPFATLFAPNDDELNAISTVLFNNPAKETVLPISEYLTKLYKCPFDVDSIISKNKQNVVLGNFDSQIQASYLTAWNIIIDGGKINVEVENNNAYDYIINSCEIYIPFFGLENIDIDDVMENTISIQYLMNLYDGNCTLIVSNNNYVIIKRVKKVVYDVPFVQYLQVSSINDFNFPDLENIYNAYIHINFKTPYEHDNNFGKSVIIIDSLSNYNGYVQIDDIILNDSIPFMIQYEIINLLKQGVFI